MGLGDAPADVLPAATTLPSLAQQLADDLDCATVAMRYSVEADFAEHLLLALYERLLAKHQPLPGALQLALTDALKGDGKFAPPALSSVTPLLFGTNAADLTLFASPRRVDFEAPVTGLFNFPSEPERFVGRLQPMLHASHALAPESAQRGVLLYGMAGSGQDHLRRRVAYRHERDRFTGYVWHKAPNEGDDITSSLLNFMMDLETQLDVHDQPFVGTIDDPDTFKRRTLPRLKTMLANNAILIVIDNVESLLTAADNWRDPRWGQLLEALQTHDWFIARDCHLAPPTGEFERLHPPHWRRPSTR